jgi:methylthioribose-1-phosphate isomerase
MVRYRASNDARSTGHDGRWCRKIGVHGVGLIEKIAARKSPGQPVNILTHCNAGWLAFVDYGSATAPIYLAHDMGVNVHVWVGETRPRNQGAALTAWELQKHGVPHTREWSAHPLSTHTCCSHTPARSSTHAILRTVVGEESCVLACLLA